MSSNVSTSNRLIETGHLSTIAPSDEYLHTPSDSPYYNESAWFSFAVPEREIGGFVYVIHRANMNLSIGGVAVWDRSGGNSYDCLYYDWGDFQPFNKDAEMFDFDMANGLSLRCKKPLEEYELRYTSDRCTMDLVWTALHEPHGIIYPPGGEQWGKSHYDQVGRTTGWLEVAGERFEVNHIGMRDRSWGDRRPNTTPRGGYPWCFPDADNGFFFKAVTDLPPQDDPIVGTTERGIWGFYLQDGEMAPLTWATRRVVERDEMGKPLLVVAEGMDDRGRQFRAEGRPVAWLNFHGYAFMYHDWMLTKWSLNGREGYGEESDFYPIQQGRKVVRSFRGLEPRPDGASE